MDEAIKEFLSARKAARIKDKVKANMSEEKKLAVEQDAEAKFSPDNWLPDAAKRAGQLSIASHPTKFSHPDSKATSIIATAPRKADGFLRTGNDSGEPDVLGNAAALDVYKFLCVELKDGKSVLKHIEEGTATIREQLKIKTASFEELRQGFLKIKDSGQPLKTSERVKQVFFPVNGGYHLLSICTPSSLMFKLRKEVHDIRFSEEAKEARQAKRKQLLNENGFAEISDLSMIGFGGTKPQNISVLNSNYGGKSYLLSSMPPTLEKRKVRLPRSNFFTNTLYAKEFSDSFNALHKFMAIDYNNMRIRDAIEKIIQSVIDKVIQKMWTIRLHDGGWSNREYYAGLLTYQKTWLDSGRKADREAGDEWLDKVITETGRWILTECNKALGGKAKKLGDYELAHIKKIVAKSREVLR